MGRPTLWRVIFPIAAAALFLGGAWLLRPLSFDNLVSISNPAQSYSEAMERWEPKQSEEAKQPLHEGGRTIRLPRRDRQVQMSPPHRFRYPLRRRNCSGGP